MPWSNINNKNKGWNDELDVSKLRQAAGDLTVLTMGGITDGYFLYRSGNSISGLPGSVTVMPSICGGRLTLQSGTPVSTSNQTAKTTVYYAPYIGTYIALYNGSSWTYLSFIETSVSVPATTSTPFDIFAYNNSGTLALETVNWSSDTARATALTLQNNIYVKTGDTTRRYLGTGRTTSSSGQCEDSVTNRLLYNYYNRVIRHLFRGEATSHTYTTASFRPWNNNSSTSQVTFICGVLESSMLVTVQARLTLNTSQCVVSVGLNGSTSSALYDFLGGTGSTVLISGTSGLVLPALGYNTLIPIELGGSSSATFSDVAVYGAYEM